MWREAYISASTDAAYPNAGMRAADEQVMHYFHQLALDGQIQSTVGGWREWSWRRAPEKHKRAG